MKTKFTDPKGKNPKPTKPGKRVKAEKKKPVTATGKIRFNG